MKKNQRKNNYVKSAKKERKQKKNPIFAADTKGRFLRKMGRLLGILCLVLGAFTLAAVIIRSHHYGTGWTFTHYFYVTICIAGVILLLETHQAEKRMSRFRYYRSFLEEKEYIMLDEIASITGRNLAFLRKDLSKMIRKKLFLQANMNREGTCLFLTREVFLRYQRGQLILTAEENTESTEQTKEGPEKEEQQEHKSYKNEQKEPMQENGTFEDSTDFEACLYSINHRLSQIHDTQLMNTASDICVRGQQLLYFKDTAKGSEVTRFLDYFLPLTDTILTTYMELEKEGLEDQAVDLKASLNTIQHSFALFVEKLIEGKRVDVEEDIAAVKMMLSKQES